MASFLFRRSLFFHFKSSNNVKLNDSFNALTEFVRRPILVKNKNIKEKNTNKKQIRSYQKCPLYIKRNMLTFFKKHFPHQRLLP